MTTKNVVADGRVPNELLGSMHRKMHEIVRRTDEGTLDPWWVVNQLQAIIEGRTRSAFPVWKTIRLGTDLKTADDFRSALKKAGMRISQWGNDILGNPAFTASETEVDLDLVNVSVGELGFKKCATRRAVVRKALSLGLALCPNEVGPQLRLQLKNQSNGEWLLVGMEPTVDSDGDLEVFSVGRSKDILCLSGNDGSPGDVWDADICFVFVLPRK